VKNIVFYFASSVLMLPLCASADQCRSNVAGKTVVISYQKDAEFRSNAGFRDRVLSKWRRVCPGYAVLRYMTPTLTEKQRGAFCLNYDEKKMTYSALSLGERDRYWQCSKPSPICESINAASNEVIAVAGAASAMVGGVAGASVAAASGVSAVAHSSGAYILTGSSGYIASTLGGASATLLGVLGAPVLGAAAVSVITVGSAIWVCH